MFNDAIASYFFCQKTKGEKEMAIDISKGTHNISFPNNIASAEGRYGHVFNMVLTANHDNGTLISRGSYVSYDQYAEDTLAEGWTGVIRQQHADGTWEVETTAVPSTGEALYVYNSPVSPYAETELQDESLFYNLAGEVAQGMTLMVGDVFTVSANGFTGTPAAQATLTYANGKYVVGQ